jgi:hypothetical protein
MQNAALMKLFDKNERRNYFRESLQRVPSLQAAISELPSQPGSKYLRP